MPTVSSGSAMTTAGSIFGWKMIVFSRLSVLVMTPARPTSEPVPATAARTIRDSFQTAPSRHIGPADVPATPERAVSPPVRTLRERLRARSGAHRSALRVVRRGRDDRRRALDSDDMHGEIVALHSMRGVDERHGEGVADRMAIATGGDETHALSALPDRLVARRVRPVRVDRERQQLLRRPVAVAFRQGGLAAREIRLVPGDPAVHPGHPGRAVLGEFLRPDAEALLQPERAEGVVANLLQAEIGARREKHPAQRDVLRRPYVD